LKNERRGYQRCPVGRERIKGRLEKVAGRLSSPSDSKKRDERKRRRDEESVGRGLVVKGLRGWKGLRGGWKGLSDSRGLVVRRDLKVASRWLGGEKKLSGGRGLEVVGNA
jgi:hypothetical protein